MTPRRFPRADWSRPLPRPLVIPRVMTLKTLADVHVLMQHLPEDRRECSTWRYVAAQLDQAAAGADTVDVAIALRNGVDVGERRVPPAVSADIRADCLQLGRATVYPPTYS